MMRYITIGALGVSLSMSGVAWWYYARAQRLAVQVDVLEARMKTCDARVQNILEAQKDAEEVDSWGGLGNAPRRWVVPEAGTGD